MHSKLTDLTVNYERNIEHVKETLLPNCLFKNLLINCPYFQENLDVCRLPHNNLLISASRTDRTSWIVANVVIIVFGERGGSLGWL